MRSLSFQRLLGSGAVGSVYLAELAGERGFRRQVAVKVMQPDHAHGDVFLSRVRDEARLLGLLADDHILKVLELTNVEGRDAVIMEYVEGVDLGAIVEAGLRPPPRALAELGAAVAGALHRAHRAVHPSTGEALNVIHRDVKPANVMVTSRGGVKLLDFGVARARFEARESQTGQFVLGTLNYMAPEYIVTGEVSSAADIYGLATTLWEAATGETFGQPKLRADLHAARVAERFAALADTHAELVPVLRQMLDWDPKTRPTGDAVERAFTAAADMLRGTGLRSWATEAVPRVLARERDAARDDVGLLGKTVPIGDADALAAEHSRVGALPAGGSGVSTSPRPPADRPVGLGVSGDRSAPGAERTPSGPAAERAPSGPAAERTPSGPAAERTPSGPAAERTPSGPAADRAARSSRPEADRGAPPPRPGADRGAPPPRPGADRDPAEPTLHKAPRPAFLEEPPPAPPPPPRRAPPKKGTSRNMLLLQGLLLGGAIGSLMLAVLGVLLLLRNLL